MSDALTVLIADDQPVVLAGLRLMLNAEPDLTVVGAASDGEEAVALAADLRPDVALLDIRMPRLDGIAATRRIVGARTAGAVMMITTFDDEAYLLDSVRAGASGFLLKDAGPDLMSAAVRSAARGDALIDPAMTRALLERRLAHIEQDERRLDGFADRLNALSEREREVLRQVTRGKTNAEIAGDLFVSEATVKTQLSSVLTKLELRSRVEAVVFAYESGFILRGADPADR